MIRALFAVVAGIALAVAVIALVESAGHTLYPPPEGLDPADREAFRFAVEQMPAAAFLFVLAAWAAGTFCGAWLAARIAGRRFYALLVGGVLMLGGVKMLVLVPHPAWVTGLGIVLFLPSAYLGGRLAAPFE